MISFEQASYLTKVRRLRLLAVELLKSYPLKIKSVEFVKLSANAIFRVTDTKNKRYQLRINPAVYHSKSAVLEEIKWLNHITEKTDIVVPKPIFTIDKQYVIEGHHSLISTSRFCTLFEWLPGKTRWKSINNQYAYNLGSLMAQLQKNGQAVNIKNRHYWSADGLVGTSKAKFYNVEKLHNVSPNEQKIITAARRKTHRKLKQYETSHKNKSGLMHGDMQPNNILCHKGNYAVIDFDDCGVGLYGDELATALCAFEHVAEGNKKKIFLKLRESLFAGYSEYMPLTQQDINLSPYFMLARKLVTIGWLEIRRDNPELRPYHRTGVKRAIKFFNSLEKRKQ